MKLAAVEVSRQEKKSNIFFDWTMDLKRNSQFHNIYDKKKLTEYKIRMRKLHYEDDFSINVTVKLIGGVQRKNMSVLKT